MRPPAHSAACAPTGSFHAPEGKAAQLLLASVLPACVLLARVLPPYVPLALVELACEPEGDAQESGGEECVCAGRCWCWCWCGSWRSGPPAAGPSA